MGKYIYTMHIWTSACYVYKAFHFRADIYFLFFYLRLQWIDFCVYRLGVISLFNLHLL